MRGRGRQAQAVACGPGRQGLGAAHLHRTGGQGHQGPSRPSQDPQVSAPGAHLTCYVCSSGAAKRRESMLVVGQAGRKSPSSPTQPPGRQLLAAGCSSSVTFRESEVRRSSCQVSSSPRGPGGPALPRPARSAFRSRPSPGTSKPHGLQTRLRLRPRRPVAEHAVPGSADSRRPSL